MYNILYSHRIPVEFPRLVVICTRSGSRVGGARVRGTTNTFGLVLYAAIGRAASRGLGWVSSVAVVEGGRVVWVVVKVRRAVARFLGGEVGGGRVGEGGGG
jgi:hypothetical protein